MNHETDIGSVAEIAKKPLYRVTCGDIRTKAEEVEKVSASTEDVFKTLLTNLSTWTLYCFSERLGVAVRPAQL